MRRLRRQTTRTAGSELLLVGLTLLAASCPRASCMQAESRGVSTRLPASCCLEVRRRRRPECSEHRQTAAVSPSRLPVCRQQEEAASLDAADFGGPVVCMQGPCCSRPAGAGSLHAGALLQSACRGPAAAPASDTGPSRQTAAAASRLFLASESLRHPLCSYCL